MGLQDLDERHMGSNGKCDKLYRSQPLLRQPSIVASGFHRELEPDNGQAQYREHHVELHVRQEM